MDGRARGGNFGAEEMLRRRWISELADHAVSFCVLESPEFLDSVTLLHVSGYGSKRSYATLV